MNVWFDNSTLAGFEKDLINHYLNSGRWNNVVYEENNTKLMIVPYFEKKMKELGSVEYIEPCMYDRIYAHLYEFIDMYSRNSPLSQNSYDSKNIHDYLNLFNIAVNYYYTRFKKEKIDLYIISRAPHIGIDFIKCLVAKELNIKTLILEQTLFSNRFHYYWDIYDYGEFKTCESLYPIEKEKIESTFEMDLFYMKSSKPSFIKKVRTSIPYFLARNFILTRKGKLCTILNTHYYNQYRKSKKKLSIPEVDYSKKYVYFALHLQPEKTTSSWGGLFNDQLLAIERLSSMIPDDWLIYVKENPIQGFFMRGEWFYKRLSMIPKTIMVPDGTNTYKLLAGCQFVSTITGTVGWEAIKGGKNVLTFGWGVWYKNFPGVFNYKPGLDAQSIAKNIIDHQLLEEQFAMLKSKMALGVTYKGFDEIVDSFKIEENIKVLVDSFDRILGYK